MTNSLIIIIIIIIMIRLTILELDNCPLVTDRGLDHLMACTHLQRIEL